MSMPKASPDHGASKDSKRNLPSWITARDDESTSQGKKLLDDAVNEDSEENATRKRAKGHGKSVKNNDEVDKAEKATSAGSITRDFSKLLEGVVFVLSGFVNPERSILRSQALEMGAEYHPDWDPNCTLLVCAFPNTPKFQQVEADCGTIVSKEWITECYNQKKLVDIESYLMHVGKPWRKNNMADADKEELKLSLARKSEKHKEKVPNLEPNTSSSSKALKSEPSESIQEKFSPLKVKKWAIDDLNKTISWLENQAEKPEPNEIRQVAAEGILTCLQDAIDLLEQQEDVSKLTEQWSMIPHAVEELILAQANTNRSPSTSKYDLRDQATVFKRIYEGELKGVLDNSTPENKNPKPKRRENVKGKNSDSDTVAECDSDETIEMNEEEIELAYNSIVSKVPA